MNRRILLPASAVAIAFALNACAVDKSSTPLSPTVAGPIPGVNISPPSTVQPASGVKLPADQQPVTLMVANAATSGVRPLTYVFEIALDANFSNIVFSRSGVAPGDGQTSLRLPDALAPERTYYWRARAEDGANTGPYSAAAQFNVYTPVIFQAPTPITPIDNVVVTSNRPRFTFANAQRTGFPESVSYLAEASDTSSFAGSVTVTVSEQAGQTSIDPPQDLPANKQVFWHVRAFDPTSTGPWSATAVFRTPAAPSSGGGGGGGGGGSGNTWSNDQWREYFFARVAARGVGPNASAAGLAALEPDLTAQGAILQRNSGGEIRGRIYLPSDKAPVPFGRPVDVVEGYGLPWIWLPR